MEFCALPSLEDVLDQIYQEKPNIFSVLDLKAGYYGIGLDENSQLCTAFSAKNRTFPVHKANHGIRDLRFIFNPILVPNFCGRGTALHDCGQGTAQHDYLCPVMHKDVDEHIAFLNQIFAKFREYQVRLHPKKMNIAADSQFPALYFECRQIHSWHRLL